MRAMALVVMGLVGCSSSVSVEQTDHRATAPTATTPGTPGQVRYAPTATAPGKEPCSGPTADVCANVRKIAEAALEHYKKTGKFCGTATMKVPPGAAPQPFELEYTPDPKSDFALGDASTGWPCLGFSIQKPIRFQYSYVKGAAPVSGGLPGAPNIVAAESFEAAAQGDLNGDGAIFSTFAITAEIDEGRLKVSEMFVHRPWE